MVTIEKIYRKGEKPPPLTANELAMLNHLASMPDTAIDTSDDWESQENVLDDDVLSWLSQQDSNTKQAINTMIRRVMAVQHV